MLPGNRVPIRVPPCRNESLRGYLMRVAVRNGLRDADQLLERVFGSSRPRITQRRAMLLSDYCRCDVPEFIQLFGIEHRSVEGQRQWQLGGEWVTKEYFTRIHRPSLCPVCLAQGAVLKGQWELTFYVACPSHSVVLIDRCPACTKSLTPHRKAFDTCNCGFSLALAPRAVAPLETRLIAALVECRLDGLEFPLLPAGMDCDPDVVERLAGLNLDTLFKSLWILGHFALSVGKDDLGRRRSRPATPSVVDVVRGALSLLTQWPKRFLQRLEASIESSGSDATGHPEACLMPLRKYLENELLSDDAGFLRAAYAQFVRDAWRRRRHVYRPRSRLDQLELF